MTYPKFRASKSDNGVVTEVTMLETGEVLSMSAFLQRQAESATLIELREAEQRSDDNVRKAAQDELVRRGETLAEHRACDACGVACTVFVYVDGRGFPCCSQACAMQIAIDRPGEHVTFSFVFSESKTRDTFTRCLLEKRADPKAWLEWHVSGHEPGEQKTHAVLRTLPCTTCNDRRMVDATPVDSVMTYTRACPSCTAPSMPPDVPDMTLDAYGCLSYKALKYVLSTLGRDPQAPPADPPMLQVVDLPPLPEGHRRVVKVTGRLNPRQFRALAERLRKDIGPVFVVLTDPGEDIEFTTENPNTFTAAGIIARATEMGFKGATIVEEGTGGIVIGYDSGPDGFVEKFMLEHRIAGMQYMMRKRNVSGSSED